jgi:phage host-nuclease inhibitor protein Gam/uncharacterized protein YodC (DUF2158 family)
MAKTRKKADKLPATQTVDEAIAQLKRYAQLDASIAARKARTEAAIASLKAQTDALNAPEEAEQKALFLSLKPWWAVAGDTVTGGERKTWELGGCLIGHRTSNPALEFPKPEATAVRLLMEQGWKGLLRIKVELDKVAIMTAIRWTTAAQVTDEDVDTVYARRWFEGAGFKIVQKEEFFIDRLPPRWADEPMVADPQAEQVPA